MAPNRKARTARSEGVGVEVYHFDDDCLTITTELGDEGLSLSFRVYEIAGSEFDGTWLCKRLYNRNNWRSLPDPVDDLAEAEVFCEGWVKWDGCINYKLTHAGDSYAHACGRKDASKLGRMMDHLYDLAAERMGSRWMGDT